MHTCTCQIWRAFQEEALKYNFYKFTRHLLSSRSSWDNSLYHMSCLVLFLSVQKSMSLRSKVKQVNAFSGTALRETQWGSSSGISVCAWHCPDQISPGTLDMDTGGEVQGHLQLYKSQGQPGVEGVSLNNIQKEDPELGCHHDLSLYCPLCLLLYPSSLCHPGPGPLPTALFLLQKRENCSVT